MIACLRTARTKLRFLHNTRALKKEWLCLCWSCVFVFYRGAQVTFPHSLPPASVEVLEKVLPPRPVTEFEGDEEEPMLEVRFETNCSAVCVCCAFAFALGPFKGAPKCDDY